MSLNKIELIRLFKFSKANLLDNLMFILIAFLAVSFVFPKLRVMPVNIALLHSICLMMWMILSFIRCPKFYFKPTRQRVAALIFTLYSFIIPYLFGTDFVGNRYLTLAPILIFYIYYEFNNQIGRSDLNRNVIIATIPFTLITLVITGVNLYINPYISRTIKSTGDYTRDLFEAGIGGYEFVYFIVLLFPIVLFISLNSNIKTQNKTRLLFICLSVVLFIFIIISNYFTATIIALACGLIVLSARMIKKRMQIILIISSILLIVFFMHYYGKQFALSMIEFLTNYIREGKTLERLYEIKYSIMYEYEIIIGNTRWEGLKLSENTFLSNPIFGAIANNKETILYNIGQHSHFMDTFAFFGIIPGILYLYALLQPYFKRMFLKKNKELLLASLVSLIALLMFNNATPSLGIITGITFPYVFDNMYLSEEKLLKRCAN